MTRVRLLLVMVSLTGIAFGGRTADAQQAAVPAAQPAPGARGGGRGGPPVVSPEVSADRTVTLRLFAPNAKQVSAAGELDGKPHPMTRGADGVWSVTVGPLAPDIYTYACPRSAAISSKT